MAACRLPVLLAALCVLTFSCSSAGEGTGSESSPCTPGTVSECTCGTDGPSGTRVCDVAKGLWGQCTCAEADVHTGKDLPGPEDGGQRPVGPGPGTAPQGVSLAAGAAELSSDNYRLRMVVGPATPAQYVESEQYRLKLGVGLSK